MTPILHVLGAKTVHTWLLTANGTFAINTKGHGAALFYIAEFAEAFPLAFAALPKINVNGILE